MHYTFSTILMTVLASNLLIILITTCFRHEKLLFSIGYRLLAVFLILTLVRFLFPFELPFTKSIYIPGVIAKYVSYFQHPFFQISFIKVSLWFLVECVWFGGALVKLFLYIRESRHFFRLIAANGREISQQEPYLPILDEICGRHKNHFQVIRLSNIDIPQVCGFFSPRILIPRNMSLSKEALELVLRHEAYHYYHRDLFVKAAVRCLCILYWWNPACKHFRAQVNLILEMHVDDSLLKDCVGKENIYFQTMLDIMEAASQRKQERDNAARDNMAGLLGEEENQLTNRFFMIDTRNKRARRSLLLALLAVMVGIYVASYAIVLEVSNHDSVEENHEMLEIREDFYAIPTENGSYDIYYNDMLIETVDTLEHYREMPVLPAE